MRRKRHYRIKRYRLKNNPRLTTLFFKENLDFMRLSLTDWLLLIDKIEKMVIDLCERQGIPAEDIKFYIAFAKQQFKTLNRFSGWTLFKELQNRILAWLMRNLKEFKLKEITQHLNQPLEDKNFLDKFKDYQLLTDYMRVKTFITTPPFFEKTYFRFLDYNVNVSFIPPPIFSYSNFLNYNVNVNLPNTKFLNYSNFLNYNINVNLPNSQKLNYSNFLNYTLILGIY